MLLTTSKNTSDLDCNKVNLLLIQMTKEVNRLIVAFVLVLILIVYHCRVIR